MQGTELSTRSTKIISCQNQKEACKMISFNSCHFTDEETSRHGQHKRFTQNLRQNGLTARTGRCPPESKSRAPFACLSCLPVQRGLLPSEPYTLVRKYHSNATSSFLSVAVSPLK